MTFEERLDRLAERHEALAQTVEFIAHHQDRNEQEIERLLEMPTRTGFPDLKLPDQAPARAINILRTAA
jgi:hypothetical protein